MARPPAQILSPGAYRRPLDRWGQFPDLFASLGRSSARILTVADRRVLALHPDIAQAIDSRGEVLRLAAGEPAKALDTVARILRAGVAVPRSGTLVAIGGGTIGDVATVAAHLLKRGVALIQVPSTLLAAVDSSVGGKGAVDLEGPPHAVKNAAGVFHYPVESWICGELFESLSDRQIFEGEVEAYKMSACLDATAWRRYRARRPPLPRLVRDSRRLKASVCAADPYDTARRRSILNFGHTFGHAFESLTGFSLSHGVAVCLGILCALDIGRALGVTPEGVAAEAEEIFAELWSRAHREHPRRTLAGLISDAAVAEIGHLLSADKKADAQGGLRMVLLRRFGDAVLRNVDAVQWQNLLQGGWREGRVPA